RKGPQAPANPWGGNSLEWHTNSPPPHLNFDDDPHGVDPYHYDAWKWDEDVQGYVIRDPDKGDPAYTGEDGDPVPGAPDEPVKAH
ncbi:MAG: hypothetical protein AAGA57_05145, partial [Planctomycetota bacterium]